MEVKKILKKEGFKEMLHGWFKDYVEYHDSVESPEIYNFFCAVTGMGALIGKRAYFKRGAQTFYPNFGVVLVGPPGVVRKTTAIDHMTHFVKDIKQEIPWMPKTITPESVSKALKRLGGTGFLCISELAELIRTQQYQTPIVPLLNSLLEGKEDWDEETIGRGYVNIGDACVSMLGATTAKWMIEMMPKMVITGGFLSRLLLIYLNRRYKMISHPQEPDQALREDLLTRALEARDKAAKVGEFVMEDKVKNFYTDWYFEHEKKVFDDDRMKAYRSRKPTHLLRLTLLLDIFDFNKKLTQRNMKMALRILERVDSSLPVLFDELELSGTQGQVYALVLKKIEESEKEILHSDLLRKCWRDLDATRLNQVATSLIDMGLITAQKRDRGIYYKLKKSQ